MAIIASLAYVSAEPYFQTFPAKVYRVQIYRSSGGLGSVITMSAQISQIGTAQATVFDKSRLESIPPIHSYLVMTSGTETTYAVAFWSTSANGTQYISFTKLLVLVSNLQEPVSFVYSSEGANDFKLGTF